MKGQNIYRVIIQEMKNVQKIIALVLIEVFARNIVSAIMFYVTFILKDAIVNQNAKKNLVLVMLMIENVIKIYVEVSSIFLI